MKTRALVLAVCLALACAPDEPPPRFNLLLVSIDTLRADHLSVFGYGRPTSPELDRLAAEGLVFERASTPRAKTTPALASLFTGLYPHEHGVRDLLTPIDARHGLLAESFARAGYQCAAIVGNYVLLERHCGFARGFEHYVETLSSRRGVPPHDAPQRGARSMTRAALAALDLEAPGRLDEDGRAFAPAQRLLDPQRPWFLWLHYMDPHGSYEPPPAQDIFRSESARWIDPETPAGAQRRRRVAEYNVPERARDEHGRFDAAAVIDLYDGEIRGVDFELGRLLERLRQRGDLARTWVVLTSDHGESLGEQDDWFEHGFYAYESTCRVPLIVRPPDALADRPAPGRRTGAISLADLGPTLAQWLGVDPPAAAQQDADGFRGVSRAGLLREDDRAPFATFSEKIEAGGELGAVQIKALRLGRYKLLRRWAVPPGEPGGAPRLEGEELYDLESDPLESRDLCAAPPAACPLEELRARLLEFSAADAPFDELSRMLQRRRAALETSDQQALREIQALGY